jgi:hypothetical protein
MAVRERQRESKVAEDGGGSNACGISSSGDPSISSRNSRANRQSLLASPSNLRLRCRTFPTSPLPLVTKLANGDPGALPGPRSGPSGLPGEAQGPVARAGADLGDCELDGEGGISAEETETELVNRAPVERTVVS